MMQTDVRSTYRTTSGAIFDQRTRVRGIWVIGGATVGTVTFEDGGSTIMTVPVAVNATEYALIPGEGVLFQRSVAVTLTGGAAGVTVYFG